MSYLTSGTTYPSQVSSTFPGSLYRGEDFVATWYNNANSLTVSGISANVTTSIQNVNYSGSNNIVLVIATQETELQNPSIGYQISSTPSTFRIFDTFGGAGGANIIVSGAATSSGTASNITINGLVKQTAVNSAYGVKTLTNISGAVWQMY